MKAISKILLLAFPLFTGGVEIQSEYFWLWRLAPAGRWQIVRDLFNNFVDPERLGLGPSIEGARTAVPSGVK